MTEDKITELLTKYTELADASPQLRGRIAFAAATRRRPRFAVLRIAVAASLVVVASGAALLYPRYAVASTLHKFETAISDARSMDCDIYLQLPDGTSQHRLHVDYLQGKWRYEMGFKVKGSVFLLRDGKTYDYWQDLSLATVSPDVDGQQAKYLTGIEYTRELSEEGSTGIPATRTIESHPDVAGRSTYAIVAVRPEDELRSVVVVDRQTNLPISADVHDTINGHEYKHHADYRFNQSLDPKLFEPDFGPNVALIDLSTEWQRLRTKWAKPLLEVHEGVNDVQVMDFRENDKGVVFLVYKSQGSWHPTAISNGEGTQYWIYGPLVADGGADSASQWSVMEWFPSETPKEPANSLQIGFGPLTSDRTIAPNAKPVDLSNAKKTVEMSLQEPVSGAYPDYAAALSLIKANNDAQFSVTEAMADYYRERHEYEEAIPLYSRAYRAMHYYIPLHEWRMLEKMGDCLDELGRHGDAAKAYAQAKQIEASDPGASKG
jgi:hypothetical protein